MSRRKPARGGPPVVWDAAREQAADGPAALAALMAPLLAGERQEVMLMALLDARLNVRAVIEVARGALDSVAVDPRVVFRAALEHGAHRIALAHNHPSGDPTLSVADRHVASRLAMGGQLLGIEVADFLAIGAAGTWRSATMDGGGSP